MNKLTSRPKGGHFDQLCGELWMLKAHQIDEAAKRPGLTALEVATLEATRNRVAAKADRVRRGEDY